MTNPVKSALDTVVRYAYDVYFNLIVARDIELLRKKDEEYGASWLEYGGVGAFFVTVRKWDRIRTQLRKHNWDIFAAYADAHTSERFADTVMDFRNYLVLWESRAIELGLVDAPAPQGNWMVKTSVDGPRVWGLDTDLVSYKEIGEAAVRLFTDLAKDGETWEVTMNRVIKEAGYNANPAPRS